MGTFNSDELLLLSLAHVLKLAKHLFVLKIVKLELSPASLRQVHLLAASLAVVIQKPKEVDNFRIGEEMYTRAREQCAKFVAIFDCSLNRVEHFLFLLRLVLVIGQAIFERLHDLQELHKAEAFIDLIILLVLHVSHELVGLTRVPTKTFENRLQVLDHNEAGLVRIEHFEDHAEVFDFLTRVHLKDFLLVVLLLFLRIEVNARIIKSRNVNIRGLRFP